jgi:hypothetical protein
LSYKTGFPVNWADLGFLFFRESLGFQKCVLGEGLLRETRERQRRRRCERERERERVRKNMEKREVERRRRQYTERQIRERREGEDEASGK